MDLWKHISARKLNTKYFLIIGAILFFLFSMSGCGGSASNDSQDTVTDLNQSEDQLPDDGIVDVPSITPRTLPCEQDPLPTLLGNQDFSVGPIQAKYYSEPDGSEPGVGTDGNDPNIVPQFVSMEEVSKVTVNYVFDNFNGIDANNFYGTWEGEIFVNEDQATILANMNSSRSNSAFYIDGELVKEGLDCRVAIPLVLTRGTHSFKVDYHSHYFSADFLFSFTDYPILNLDDVNQHVSPLINDFTQAVVVSGYDTDSADKSVTVSLPMTVDSLVLVLSSYNPLFWQVENPYGVNIEAILITSNDPGSAVNIDDNVPVYFVEGLLRAGDNFAPVIRQVEELTGLSPTYLNSKDTLVDLSINSSTNMLDDVVIGDEVIVLDNYMAIDLITNFADSKEGGQQIASYFQLEKDTVINRLEWAGAISINYPDSENSNSYTLRPHPFILKVYAGTNLPTTLYAELEIEALSEERYESAFGVVNRFSYEDTVIFNLPTGDYWLSIVEPTEAETDFKWILDANVANEESGMGGAFKQFDHGIWYSTVSSLEATSAPAGNLFIGGIELLELAPRL